MITLDGQAAAHRAAAELNRLSPSDQASIDALLREATRFIQAGALDPNLMHSEVLALSLSLAVSGQLEEVRARLSEIEEQLKGLKSFS